MPGELVLGKAFFGQGGFQDFELVGIDGVRVAAGFRLEPSPRLRQLDASHRLRPSGAALDGFTRLVQPAEWQRPPTRVALRAENFYRGDVRVDAGALLRVTPQGEIDLTAKNRLTVLGSLEAPAGRITLRQTLLLDGEKNIDNFDRGLSRNRRRRQGRHPASSWAWTRRGAPAGGMPSGSPRARAGVTSLPWARAVVAAVTGKAGTRA